MVLIKTLNKVENKNLFSGIWIRWNNLTVPEKVVCANISLIAVWWGIGIYRFMAALIFFGIAWYEQRHYGRIRLKKPSLSVVSLFIFVSYRLVGSIFYKLATDRQLNIAADVRYILFWYGLILLLWYIQSNNIRVRLEVVAWAFSLLVIQMLLLWVIGQLILGGRDYTYPRTIFSLAAGNAEGNYEHGAGLSNYLIPYLPYHTSIAGLKRWSFFFIIPEILALVVAYINLVSLDIKNRLWSISLLIGSFFLVLVSGTRSVWLLLPIIVILRYTFIYGKIRGYAIPLALLAIISFTTLSFPSVTDSLLQVYSSQAETVGEVRADSTEVRSEIYQKTLEAIPDKLIFGHWVVGETVLPGFELGRVGTHSFILGTLLYHLGIVGTSMFLTFWISFAVWLYQTRQGRYLSTFLLIILYTLLSTVMEFGELIACMLVLLAAIVGSPIKNNQTYFNKWNYQKTNKMI
ncbi:MAG: O-antigen ligase family protein [Richelia sp. RM2_1_2]|nr:O-antigen ligase family protein [Richelia sp. SM2_1_7]NJN11849.1 O-antigen ligase family protein [Richelia sp. RM1_1_1]NJO29776.1 O-antigen ligase family protein [Richelia sp. SL_2_1]NJO58181.1 O-antigen ligase family protein [Richelia sp. RM2_1_2]